MKNTLCLLQALNDVINVSPVDSVEVRSDANVIDTNQVFQMIEMC